MVLRALLLAWCAYAWTAEAWAPPRRLAPLRIGNAWATPRGRRAAPRVRLLAATEETEVPKNVAEDAPLELTNKILRGMRSFPALVGAGALSWLAPPTLVGTAFFLTGGTDLSREVLNSIEDVVLASLSIVLGTLVSTAVSVLRDRQEKIRCCMLREASLLDTLAQQLVKLFRYDKARLKRVTNVLERYVEDCAEIKFWTPHAIDAITFRFHTGSDHFSHWRSFRASAAPADMDDVTRMRPLPEARTLSSSRLVSKKGAMTLTASEYSLPSSVTTRWPV